MAGESWEFDIREACRNNYVRYLRDAVDMLSHGYPDVDVVDNGSELGPCLYKTVFMMSVSDPEDYKAFALAVSRVNQFIRDIKARLVAYGWNVFEKESYTEGNHVYTVAVWVKKIRLPDKRYATAMDIYELALPYIEAKRGEGAGLSEVLAEAQ
jgi:hypothetical protein